MRKPRTEDGVVIAETVTVDTAALATQLKDDLPRDSADRLIVRYAEGRGRDTDHTG